MGSDLKQRLARLATAFGKGAVDEARGRLQARVTEVDPSIPADCVEVGAVVATAYPALERQLLARPGDLGVLARGARVPRDARTLRKNALSLVGSLDDPDGVRAAVRVFAQRERLRVAARELLYSGVDVDVTARELSDIADVSIEIAADEARAWADQRFGAPLTATQERCAFSIVGMGKLGGRELNCGSDVDLILFYETDDGEARSASGEETSLHEYFTRFTQRVTSTLEDVTHDGFAWRVDWRLRPEGSRGPLVNALAAAERYYESWGRTWERAAMVRARHVAGEPAFGAEVAAALAPFVWRREVNPKIASEMIALLHQARAELSADPERDLKLGPGGIREVEFFVQSLQLVWGGREPQLRDPNTLGALRRLRARGFVTDRESRELADAYLTLRRLEHRVQYATGQQTHTLPEGALLRIIAKSLGFRDEERLAADLAGTRRRVSARLASLAGGSASGAAPEVERLLSALASGEEGIVQAALPPSLAGSPDSARHLVALADRPDSLLGAATRDRHPEVGSVVVEALGDAADPEQAARLLAAFFSRHRAPGVYARALAEDPHLTRRLVGLFGASAFLGEAMVGHPELVDRILYSRGVPDEAVARRAVEEEIAASTQASDEDPLEAFVGALRRAKARVTMEVGLADLAGDVGTRGSTLTLSALADAELAAATSYALAERGLRGGLAVIAMGKLGGREIGYGSDLDVIFVYDDAGADDAGEAYIRTAQRVMRLLSTPHGDGPGYELDARLRPSGNQGLLVVSMDSFARYHGAASGGEPRADEWERQALIKARLAAGDPALGARVVAVAEEAAYEHGEPSAERLHHIRMRMQRELARERREGDACRYDLKLGEGGIVDVEFAVQWLQMKYGRDRRVRTTETRGALLALEACGYLDSAVAATLREGYRFLRRLEQRLRVLHGTSVQLIEQGAPGLPPLARRMGMRDDPERTAGEALLAQYQVATQEVRAAYLSILGLG
ncbi:MAG: bifunctional [glutamate--ammonia ligase]-adenylyl-L-tyrosine phosphorylase/[glutamate--ammonia-ligase] adenylyltransferase [Myxococcales bacterium]|nr:bifunctional [glutamate--ammonia ligase]-adenylyl-L-tyrosine phosphorylase/[glutamate--ammonia-ligase] adenylyltransferase [Myxococcales bacterium]